MPRKPPATLGLALALLILPAIHAQAPPSGAKPGETRAGAAAPALKRGASPQGEPVEELLKSIAGREKEPAEAVFKNVQILKQVSAGQLIDVMKSFSRALGVRCNDCHVPGQWEKDEKPDKQIAREMLKMTNTINTQLLPGIKGLMSDKPEVTCATCHRGQETPATSMDSRPERPQRPAAPPAKPDR
jgi:hypothetical protein